MYTLLIVDDEEIEREARLLKPLARQQMFRDLLLGRAQPGAGGRALVEELGGSQRQVMLLDFRLRSGFDALERYVVGNMLSDLLPDGASDDRRGRQGRPGPGRRGD